MKRTIEVSAPGLRIKATIDNVRAGHPHLTRDEVELVRDDLADSLQTAASDLRYIGVARNRVRVK